MKTHFARLTVLALLLAALSPCPQLIAAEPAKTPPKKKPAPAPTTATATEHFTKAVLALQGVWVSNGDGPRFARLIVHGSYFLLIYQWPQREADLIEVRQFTADGEFIRDAKGDKVLTYGLTDEKTLSFEVRDTSLKPASKYAEFSMTRSGRLPDLGLGKK